MKYLCDTNIISELARKKPYAGVLDWAEGVTSFAMSVISIEEIYYGLSWKPNQRISNWFESFFKNHVEVLTITCAIAKRAGSLRGELQAHGKPRTQADIFIAATASEYGLTMVTRNENDFEGCGVAILNPFEKTIDDC